MFTRYRCTASHMNIIHYGHWWSDVLMVDDYDEMDALNCVCSERDDGNDNAMSETGVTCVR